MKKIYKIFIFSFLFLFLVISTSCSKTNNNEFQSWKDCDSLTALKSYVEDVTNEKSKNYIPKEDRIATFDMDGTLYGELFPAYFEYLLFCHRVLDDKTYTLADEEMIETATTIRNNKYTWAMTQPGLELKHARGQAKAFAGLTENEFVEYVQEFAKTNAEGFKNLTYADATYKPMIEVVNYLQKNDFITYVVSGSDRFICRAVASKPFNIPYNQIIGMDATIVSENQGNTDGLEYQLNVNEKVIRGDELLIKNLKMNKVTAITKEIGKQPVLAFGNSSGDVSMLNYAISNPKYKGEGYMLIADDEARDYVNMEETNKRKDTWEKNKYHIISMKNDFKTIYGDNVEKTK